MSYLVLQSAKSAAQPAVPAVAPRAPVAPQSLQASYGAPKPASKATFRPTALRLDDQGREIDEFGNLVPQRTEAVTTLKVGVAPP